MRNLLFQMGSNESLNQEVKVPAEHGDWDNCGKCLPGERRILI